MQVGDVAEMRRAVTDRLAEILDAWSTELHRCGASGPELIAELVDACCADLTAYTLRDPASKGSWRYVLQAYSGLTAVFTYRLAHRVLEGHGPGSWDAMVWARRMAERAKVSTGVEIHPGASIGPGLVIDHGIGTVIGEDVVMGSDCYLLQGVVLGATGIADNPSGRRHPWLGDRVQVGGFARLLGPISIGSDVLIGSHVLVRTDVPNGCHVTLLNHCQVVSGRPPLAVYGIETLGLFRFRIHGARLDHPAVVFEVLDADQRCVPSSDYSILYHDDSVMAVDLSPNLGAGPTATHLRVSNGASSITVAIPPSRARLARISP